MYLLDVCTNPNLAPVWRLIGYLVNAIMIGVPILLIVLGMIDLGKAVIASKEDEVKKATKAFGKRFLYAAGVFAVVWLVSTVFSLVANLGLNEVDGAAVSSWQGCWACIKANGEESNSGDTNDSGCHYTLTGSGNNSTSGNQKVQNPTQHGRTDELQYNKQVHESFIHSYICFFIYLLTNYSFYCNI